MIVDTSAIIAILLKEPGFTELLEKLGGATFAGIGTPTITEAAIVLSARLKSDSRALLTRFLHESGIETIPFGDLHYNLAVDAWLRYGKGRHRARLNFGDCLSYATAKVADLPLLCAGTGFAKTDVVIA